MRRCLPLCFLILVSCTSAAAQTPASEVIKSAKANFRIETVASGLANPWALAFLPDGRLLVTERPGRMRIVSREGKISEPIDGVPEVAAVGQGGLLDVVLAPDFAQSRTIYFTYAEPRGQQNGTSVARARLAESGGKARLESLTVIFRQEPAIGGGFHFGSRIAIAGDGTLFVTLGERFRRDAAQDLSGHLGKVIRIRPDGSVPPDNPFLKREGARPEIWSWGHRNPQSAAMHPQTRKLWIVEHGPRGGDEINIPEAGKNYGWPVIGYGVDYSGARIHAGTHREGMEQPIYHWVPSIAPCGMAFYTGEAFPGWRGSLFVGSLARATLIRLDLDGEKVTGEERLLEGTGMHIRDVRLAPDGTLYLLTDARDAKILRLVPAK
jgi:glucose/arabinose dehydrogenase